MRDIRTQIVLGSALIGSGLVLYAASPAVSRPVVKTAKAPARSGKLTGKGGPAAFDGVVAPLLVKYCGSCHAGSQATAGVDVTRFKDEASVQKERTVWEKIARNLESQHMPPKNMPQPAKAERERLVGWIDGKLADCNLKDPGRVTLRRLNRAEYNNTIRDLVGVAFKPAEDFPSDDVGYGFDNIGDVLSLSPLLMEKYVAAAEKIVHAAIVTGDSVPAARFEAERLTETGGQGAVDGDVRILYSNGEVSASFAFPKDGEYLLRARAYGQQAGDEPAKMTFKLDGKDLQTVDVPAVQDSPQVYETKLQVQAGKRQVAVAFINDIYMQRQRRDRNLVVDYLEVAGPLNAGPKELPESHKRIFIVQPTAGKEDEAARKILQSFAHRAYRRSPTTMEVDRLVRVYQLARKQGDSFERGIQLGVEAALVSPNFLFRVELNRSGSDPKKATRLDDYELASRLSYFLWSSMPDDELFVLAARGKLHNDAVLESQVRRMLKDPKSEALVENFAGQWLQLRNLDTINPDPKTFPQFNDALRAAMREETNRFFQAVMREDRSILDLLDGKFTYLNEPLAKLYGIPNVTGKEFRRVDLDGVQRGGILTQASILTITSNPTRTSPVKRGKWIMEQVLGTPPPPPPPDVPELKDGKDAQLTGSLRQRLEQHRKDPGCASCHSRMDPLGFALENYDAIGAWRDKDGQHAIDPSGTMPDGRSFKNSAELKAILKQDREAFARSFTRQLMTFGLGRGLEYYDRCAVDTIAAKAAPKGYKFSVLVTEVVRSDPFRMRRGEETE